MGKGYVCIGLSEPKYPENIGHALRAAFCFGASIVFIESERKINFKKLQTDTPKAYRYIPVIQTKNILEAIPTDCTIISVELTAGSVDMAKFEHPERALYIFGPENGSVREQILTKSKAIVQIPTPISLNLGMAVNITMYDRMVKK